MSDRPYDRHNLLIHDYFFAKTIDKVRAGGIIAFITSNGISGGTMDKKDSSVREYLANREHHLPGQCRDRYCDGHCFPAKAGGSPDAG